MNLSRLKKLIFLHLQHLPMPSRKWRPLFCKWGGVSVVDPKSTFIGEDVVFDTNYPQDVIINKGVTITTRCIFLTHFIVMEKDSYNYTRGTIEIGERTYIGCNTVVCKSVKIGSNVVIGACSVVTKDIPDNEVWAGNPARFIRKR